MSTQRTELIKLHLNALNAGCLKYTVFPCEAILKGGMYHTTNHRRIRAGSLMKPDSIMNEYTPVMFVWCKAEDLEEAKLVLYNALLARISIQFSKFQEMMGTMEAEPVVEIRSKEVEQEAGFRTKC